MEITIKLTPQQQSRLLMEASECNVSLMYHIKRKLGLTNSNLTPRQEMAEDVKQMFDAWRMEDATDDEEELARRDAEFETFKANMNANRADEGREPVFV